MERLLKLPEVAKILGKSTKTVKRLIEDGELAHIRIGVSTMFSVDQLTEFFERNTVKSTKASSYKTTRPTQKPEVNVNLDEDEDEEF